jgi:hypothetical protein
VAEGASYIFFSSGKALYWDTSMGKQPCGFLPMKFVSIFFNISEMEGELHILPALEYIIGGLGWGAMTKGLCQFFDNGNAAIHRRG